jgi:hypothetical protein
MLEIVDLETNRKVGGVLISLCLFLLFEMLVITIYLFPKEKNQAYQQGRTEAYQEMADSMLKNNVILNPKCN